MLDNAKFVLVMHTEEGIVTNSIRSSDTRLFEKIIGPTTEVCVFREGVKIIEGSLYSMAAIANRLELCGLQIEPGDIITSESDKPTSRVALICVEVPPSRG